MFKKIFLILVCSIIVFSCGKKGDPEYKSSDNNIELKAVIAFVA